MATKTLEELYRERCAADTDIHEHLPILRELANDLDNIVEFGVRDGNSSLAFLTARISDLRSVDLDDHPGLDEIRAAYVCAPLKPGWRLVLANDLDIEIPDCDLLFIDSNHTSAHLEKELAKHAHKVRRYIALHDTETFWDWDQFRGEEGMGRAITEFLATHPEWQVKAQYHNCNGLMIWERG